MIERLLRAFRYQSTRPGRGMKPLPEYVIEPLAEFLIRPTDLRISASGSMLPTPKALPSKEN